MDVDVIIVGAGTAGSWLAYNLAPDVEVLVLEKESWPRYKTCGGALSRKALNLLQNKEIYLPETVVENTINKFSFCFGSQRTFSLEYQGQGVKLVNRKNFDDFLLKQACNAGAIFHDEEKVIDIKIFEDRVIVKTAKCSYTAQIVVGADGVNSKTAQILELYPDDINKNKSLSIEAEIFNNSKDYRNQDKIMIDFDFVSYGYAWVFPKKDQLSIGFGSYKPQNFNYKEKLTEYLSQLNITYHKDDLFYHGHPVPRPGGAAKNIKLAGNRFILVGDAAFLVDPFVGEGIYYACLSAEIAAETIIKNLAENNCNLNQYHKEIRQKLYTQLMIAEKLSNWFYGNPVISRNIISFKPDILNKFIAVIQGEISYNGLLKIAKPILSSSKDKFD